MEMSKEKAQELGIIIDKRKCLTCNNCCIKNDAPYCKAANEVLSIMYVAMTNCPLVTEEELKNKMTPEEYQEYLYGEINIVMKQ